METLRRLDDLPVSPQRIRAHAEQRGVGVFQAHLKAPVEAR